MKFKALTSYFLISCSWLSPLYGIQTDENQPVLYYADSQTYDRELGILILKGHVEFDHEGSILEADYVTYNEMTDIVTASGNVRLRQPDGQIDFVDYLELTGDMKEGIVLQLRSLLEDDSKIVALEGRKFEDRQELDQAVYTPCRLCGDKLPTWQINGRHVVKDDVNKDLVFTDAEFRFFDVPLIYFPYATQPLERRSGFLPALPRFIKDFGAVFRIPYYIAISEDKDATLTPVYMSENGPMLIGEYRQAFGSGKLEVEGSIAHYIKSEKDKEAEALGKMKEKKNRKESDFPPPQTRGHVFGNYKQNLNDIWRLKLAGGYVSDKTYLRKYRFGGWQSENALISKAILEGFLNQRDYAAAKVYHFQGLRVNLDHQARISVPLPIIEYSAYSRTDPLGGRFKFDGNLLNLYRQKGLNMQRGVGEVGWQRPWNTPLGQIYTVFASLRGDLYKVEHSQNIGKRERKMNLQTGESVIKTDGGSRFFPQTGLDWRWPFINSFCGQSVVLQPVGQLVAAPVHAIGVKARKIPNEDSQDPEFNDANLFSPDRFPGYDRIDTGSRAVYGGEILTTGSLFGDVELFFGQSYALSKQEQDRRRQVLKLLTKRRASDYVGRIEATPFSWLSLNYRFRLDEKSLHHRIAEVGGSVGPEISKLMGTYLFVSRHALFINRAVEGPRRTNFSQLKLTFSSQFTKEWTFTASIIKDFQKQTLAEQIDKVNNHHGILSQGVALNYKNDCFGMGFGITQQNYRSRDLRPGVIYAVNLWLKNIGSTSFSGDPFDALFGESGFFNDKKDSDKKDANKNSRTR